MLEAKALAERDVPDYIEADHTKMTAKLTRVPAPAEVPYPVQMEPHLVVEYLFALISQHARRKRKAAHRAAFLLSGAVSRARQADALSFTGRPFSFIRPCSSPAWNISRTMSQPPTNSPFT